jgi:hypothetical protein
MSPDVFQEGQVYTIEVRDSRRNAAEKEKADAEIYSVVTEIISVDRNSAAASNAGSINQESPNQKSRITQSTNQAINQSRWHRTRKRHFVQVPRKSFASTGRRQRRATKSEPEGRGVFFPAQANR